MSNIDKYSKFLEIQQSYSSIFESKKIEKLHEVATMTDHMVKRLKDDGWKEKTVDDETSDKYLVFHHPKKDNHQEYYVDKAGEHFYHFYHNDGKTHIDGGLSHTFKDHMKHLKGVKEDFDWDESEPLQEAFGAIAARAISGLASIGKSVGGHAASAAKMGGSAVNSAYKGIKKGLGTVGHLDLLTHNLGSTGTLSLQAGFIRQKDGNGRPSGDYKFNMRLRHDNWRTGQRTVRDLVGTEYKKKKDQEANSQKTFKARFRYGRNQHPDDVKPTPPPGDSPSSDTGNKSSSQQAYDAFAHSSGKDNFKK